MGNTVGLVMIVKNERDVILRCLASMRPLIDYVLIVDTGSSDDTIQTIRAYLETENLPGDVLERPWRNFAANRSEALEALRRVETVDYGVTIDADETLAIDPGLDIEQFKADLKEDLYSFEVHNGQTIYRRPMLFSNRKAFVYKAVLHEYLEAPPGSTRALGGGLHVVVSYDGARSQNPNKYAEDAALLVEALRSETDPFLISRYNFYLAQSYRDSGQNELSYETYLKRAGQGGWIEEVYVSLLRAAQLGDKLGHSVEQRLGAFLAAYEALPSRAEALCAAAALCREAKRYNLGYLLARQGISLPKPTNSLFLDQSVYAYRMLDEFQINAYWSGHYAESVDASATLLHDDRFPESQRKRITDNAGFAMRKLGVAGVKPD